MEGHFGTKAIVIRTAYALYGNFYRKGSAEGENF